MKKIISIIFTLFSMINCLICETASAEEDNKSAIYAEDINNGEYDIEVTSSSSMFKIVECKLQVADDKMNAVMTLSGKGYEKLFMGTGEETLNASEDDFIFYVEDEHGKYTYTVPVEALNKDIDCAAWSIKKEKWYDRVLVFESDTIPEEALINGGSNLLINSAIIVVIILIAAAATAVIKKMKKPKEN